MSDFETNIGAYTGGAAAFTALGAAVAAGAMFDAVNRNIVAARATAVRRQIADRIRRDRVELRQLEVDLAVAKCDAALARYHLNRLARMTSQPIKTRT